MQLSFATSGDMTIDLEGAIFDDFIHNPDQNLIERFHLGDSSLYIRIKNHNTSVNGVIRIKPVGSGQVGNVRIKTCSHAAMWWARTHVRVFDSTGKLVGKSDNVDSGTNIGAGDSCGTASFPFRLERAATRQQLDMLDAADPTAQTEEYGIEVPLPGLNPVPASS